MGMTCPCKGSRSLVCSLLVVEFLIPVGPEFLQDELRRQKVAGQNGSKRSLKDGRQEKEKAADGTVKGAARNRQA